MFNAMIETLKANPRKIVFTEGHDARILEATARLNEGKFLTPILIGNVKRSRPTLPRAASTSKALRSSILPPTKAWMLWWRRWLSCVRAR